MRNRHTIRLRSSPQNPSPIYRALCAVAAATASLLAARNAVAQIDINPPLPNILLIVDTSGSMEFNLDGSKVKCNYVDATLPTDPQSATPDKSRWTQLVEVLTGDVMNYGCYTQDRHSAGFRDEFALNGKSSYDYGYYVPYHRILSGSGCTVGPGTVDPSAPFAWPTTAFKFHPWDTPTTTCNTFQQGESGLLDAFRPRARFGLMTFDTSIGAGTGLSGTSADYATGVDGTWSYFLNWRSNPVCNSNPDCAKARPAGCATGADMEVGARNAAAPPWEGRMIAFGAPTAPIGDVYATNEKIQQALLAIRPFGATPIDGILSDARDFFWNDTSSDPTIPSSVCNTTTGNGCFGPKYDPYLTGGCRGNFIILLTDGQPNLALRPWCEGTGICPYQQKSEEIVYALSHPTNGMKPVKTFVVGFAVSTVDGVQTLPVDCSTIAKAENFEPTGLCGTSMDPKMAACCTLAKIAYYGGTSNPNAYFADNAVQLRDALTDILSKITSGTTSRTLPVFGSTASGNGAYSFFSSFRVLPGVMWQGVLERQRTICCCCTTPCPAGTACPANTEECSSTTPPPGLFAAAVPVDLTAGDKFDANVNAADASHPRKYYTVLANSDGLGYRWSDRTIRPNIDATDPLGPDGAGNYSGVQVTGSDTDFWTTVDARAMRVEASSCTNPTASSDEDCADRYMKWEIGVPNGSLPARIDANGNRNVFGDIYHSTPVIVEKPSGSLRDESYADFTAAQAARPSMIYTATNDGQLHAFKIAKNPADTSDTFDITARANNEIWSFFPPGVLPRLQSQYSSTHQILLDGPAVVKDVIFVRTGNDAKGGVGAWRTVLVAGYGAGGTGYYALDITNPIPRSGVPDSGPKFLWQLTTDAAGNRLFGKRSGKPVITTLFFDPTGGSDPQQYAVAILPGGESDGPLASPSTGCPLRPNKPDAVGELYDQDYHPRPYVRCWADDPARSVTIVRLDTGEIIRSFRKVSQDGPSSVQLDARSKNADGSDPYLAAPMTGEPVVYPSTTGAAADRAFIGDRDGMLWRLNLVSSKPAEWTIGLFFDAFPAGQPTDGQPIATPPILSVDQIGNLTLAFSTGDQETLLSSVGMTNYLWSLRENISGSSFKSKVLWYSSYSGGKRVTGPMQLFNSILYYTTFTPIVPDMVTECTSGDSQLCGVHYMTPKTNTNLSDGGFPALVDPTSAPSSPVMVQCFSLGAKTMAFGPGLVQKPTCAAEVTYSDPYMGYGQHTGLSDATGGAFQLIVQTGTGGTAIKGGSTNVNIQQLKPPVNAARIDSWAAVIE